MDVLRAVGLVVVLVAVSTAAPHPAASGRGLAIAVALGVCTAAWVAWMRAGGAAG